MKGRKVKKTLKNILFSIIIVSLFFVALEIAWRLKIYYTSKDPTFLFYGKNYFELRLKSICNRIYNSIYCKKDDYIPEKLIMTFGGSTTQCSHVKKEDSWPSRLGYYLNINAINNGRRATNLEENLCKYRSYFYNNEELPDLAIFYLGINDAADTVMKPGERIRPNFFAILNCRLMNTSLLYASLKEKYFQVVKKDINKAWELKSTSEKMSLERFQKNLNHVADLSNDFNVKLMICMVPISQKYFDQYPRVTNTFNGITQIMERTAAKKNVYFLNVHKEIFIKHKDFDKYYLDGVHLNEEGNDLIAQYLADYIEKHNILK